MSDSSTYRYTALSAPPGAEQTMAYRRRADDTGMLSSSLLTAAAEHNGSIDSILGGQSTSQENEDRMAAISSLRSQSPRHVYRQSSAPVIWEGMQKEKAKGKASRRRDCHLADIPSPCLLKHLLKGEGGAPE